MPLLLSHDDLAMLHALAAPIDANRPPEFMGAVTTKLEAAVPAAVGPGALNRTARTVLRDFWNRRRIFVRDGSDLSAEVRMRMSATRTRTGSRPCFPDLCATPDTGRTLAGVSL